MDLRGSDLLPATYIDGHQPHVVGPACRLFDLLVLLGYIVMLLIEFLENLLFLANITVLSTSLSGAKHVNGHQVLSSEFQPMGLLVSSSVHYYLGRGGRTGASVCVLTRSPRCSCADKALHQPEEYHTVSFSFSQSYLYDSDRSAQPLGRTRPEDSGVDLNMVFRHPLGWVQILFPFFSQDPVFCHYSACSSFSFRHCVAAPSDYITALFIDDCSKYVKVSQVSKLIQGLLVPA